MLAASGHPQLP